MRKSPLRFGRWQAAREGRRRDSINDKYGIRSFLVRRTTALDASTKRGNAGALHDLLPGIRRERGLWNCLGFANARALPSSDFSSVESRRDSATPLLRQLAAYVYYKYRWVEPAISPLCSKALRLVRRY